LDEERKRAELARLAQLGSEASFQQEMMTDPVLAQRLAPGENRRAFDASMQNVSDYQSQGLAAAQEASGLLQQEIPQDPIRDNFFTRRGKNPALNLLRGIVGQRLISRGLLEDPTDIATRNLRAVQQRNAQIEGLQSQSDFYTNMADRLRADAVYKALAQGVPGVSPVQGLPTTTTLEGLNRAAGTFATPGEQIEQSSAAFDLGQDIAGDARYQQQRALLPGLVAGGVISPQQAEVFKTQGPDELNESLTNLRVAAEGGDSLPGDRVNPVTGEAFLSDAYTPEDRKQVRLFGRELTSPEEIANNSYGEIHEEYRRSGRFIDAQNVADLTKVVNYLIEADDEGFKFFTGPIAGKIPDAARAFYDEGRKSLDTRAALRNVVQKTFREILGGQFAFLEGERLIQNAYDENLPPEYNLIRVRRLLFQAQEIAKAGAERAGHFDKYGTLFGVGEKQLDSGLDGLVASVTDATISKRGLYSLFSSDEREEMFNILFNKIRLDPDNSAAEQKELESLKAWEDDNK
jgi:hypothetical protein